MKSSALRILTVGLMSLLVGAAGCSGCSEDDTGGSNNGIDCPDGIIVQGECIRGGSDASDTPMTQDVEDGTDPTDATDSNEEDTQEDVQEDVDGCLPFDSQCASPTSYETCDAAGEEWSAPQSCPADEVCNDGICVVGVQCEPGEVNGCRSPNSQRICADDGVSYDERLCPSESPNCFDGECIAGQCLPDAVFCDGQDLKVCNGTGDGATVQETCEAGCLDGACLEPPDDECGGKSYIGCDFWAVDLDNYTRFCSSNADCQFGTCQGGVCPSENASSQQYAVTVSNTSANNVDVEVFDGTGTSVATRTVGPNALETIELPRRDTNNSGLTNNSYQVTATGPVTVHQFNPESNVGVFSNDASLLLPSNALGKEYVLVGWPTLQKSALNTGESTNKAYVTIVAAESGQTSVTVETPVTLQAGSGVSQINAGGTQTFTMNQGQVLQLATIADSTSEYDMTGLSVSSDKNVAVFSAHECATVPTDTPACDHLEQQLVPTNTWGNEYVAPKFRPRGNEPDVFRIISATDGNQLTTTPAISGVNGQTLDRGDVIEFESTSSFVVNGTSPISVAQYMVGANYPGPNNGCNPNGFPFPDTSQCAITTTNSCELPDGRTVDFRIGDPAFTINVPTTQFRQDYFVLTPSDYISDYVSVVHPPGVTVNMDGSPITGTSNRIQNTNWVVTWVDVQPGAHQFTANQDFGLYSYGYDCFVSYAYPGGLDLEVGP